MSEYKFQYKGKHYTISEDQQDILENGQHRKVRPTSFKLALYLAANAPRVLTWDKIRAHVWESTNVGKTSVHTQINALRNIVGDKATDPEGLIATRGGGYSFTAKVNKLPATELLPFESNQTSVEEILVPVELAITPPRRVSLDMTVLLAAESYLRCRSTDLATDYSDPFGSICLKDLVDLIVNSDCYFTLPSDSVDGSRPLVEDIEGLKLLPNCAAVPLKDSVERRIFQTFWETIEIGRRWVAQWLKSQLWNPIVHRRRLPYLGKEATHFATIADKGVEWFDRLMSTSKLRSLPPLIGHMPPVPYWTREIEKADGSLAAFQYYYAFTVFRRGWQYAEAARQQNLGIIYCPHYFRQHALDGSSDAWIDATRERFWSVGRYIVRLVDRAPEAIEWKQIAELINTLRANKVPGWIDIPEMSAGSEEHNRTLKELMERRQEATRIIDRFFSRLNVESDRPKPLGTETAEMQLQTLRAAEVLKTPVNNIGAQRSPEFRKMRWPKKKK